MRGEVQDPIVLRIALECALGRVPADKHPRLASLAGGFRPGVPQG